MKDKIQKEIIIAMKARDSFRLGILKLIKSEIQNNEKSENKKSVEDIISSFYKKLAKNLNIPDVETKNPEFYKKTLKELVVVKEFMPKELSEDELKKIVNKHLNAENMGSIMKLVKVDIAETGSMFDGKKVSELIRHLLQSAE